MKKIILFVILFLFITGCSVSNEKKSPNVQKISVKEVKNIVDNSNRYLDVLIVDVRSVEEFESGHIQGAINVPLNDISENEMFLNKKIILYCQSGRRSGEAAILLEKLGYKNILDMGGIQDWPYELVK